MTCQRGITLVELSIVLLIIGILLKATVIPLDARLSWQKQRAVTQQLDTIRTALIGHLLSTGALPCPLIESIPASESCRSVQGYIPASSLGLQGSIDKQGALLDPWGMPYIYALSLVEPLPTDSGASLNANISTSISAGAGAGTGTGTRQFLWATPDLAARTRPGELYADLVLCRQAVTRHCTKAELRADQIVFVVLSTGQDNRLVGAQQENQDRDKVFVVRDESIQDATRYDDHIVWASRSELSYWLLHAAGLL